jgi:type II secretory pathway predicted ATPase ExeA
MTHHTKVYDLEIAPIILKHLILECSILQRSIATQMGVSRATINLCVNRGVIPPSIRGFKEKLQSVLSENAEVMEWLTERQFKITDIWNKADEPRHRVHPVGCHAHPAASIVAFQPGDPEKIESVEVVEMLDPKTMKHFKLFRSPFLNDVQKAADIYKDDDHRYIEAAMMDAARHSGFLAVVGEVGSGKSTMRKLVVEQLRREGDIQVVYPEILDKDRISSASLCDAIVMDISSEKPKIKHEHKARQVKRLLLERSQQGTRCCLVIEEAHRLNIAAFKTLKQIYELEDTTGYRKLISIILIGQTELGDLLDERFHPEMREVIRRCQVARIDGMNNCREYLEHKIRLVGGKVESIFDDESVALLQRRLTAAGDRGRSVSTAYPLTVNLYATRAMNLACELGEERVTAEVVAAI